MEQTFVMIKPGAVARGLVGEILARFEHKGFKIKAMRFLQMDRQLAEEHYAEHQDKDFFGDLVGSIISGPVAAFVFEGPEAISVARRMMGVTNPLAADPGTIRGDLGMDIEANVVHGSDGPESARREIALYFNADDIT